MNYGQRLVIFLSAVMIVFSGFPLHAADESRPTTIEKELEQMVITSSRSEQRVLDAVSIVHVITADDIAARKVQDIQDLLREIPGVQIIESTGSWGNGGNIQLMGMNSDATLILVDGQRFTGGHGAVDISSIPVENIERIEVVKGPASALYGSEAMGGVVHIITKKGKQGLHFRAGGSAGSRDRYNANTGADFGTESLRTRIDYTHRQTSGVDTDTDKVFQDTVSMDVAWQPTDKLSLRIQPMISRQKNEVDGDPDRLQQRRRLNAKVDVGIDEVSTLETRASYFSHDHYTRTHSTDAKTGLYEFETGYARQMGRHLARIGYAYLGETIDDAIKTYTDDSQDTHSVYLQDEMNFDPFWITLGARLDHHDEWGSEFNPRLGVLFKATDRLRFRASVGTAFLAPTLTQLYADGWRMGPYTMHANPDLDPEESLSWQAGVDYQVLDTMLIRLGFFRNEVDDLIETVIVGRHIYYRNVDEARTQGIEATLTWRPIPQFGSVLSYTWTDAENRETGEKLADRPEHKATLDLDYAPGWDLRFRLTTSFIGEREYEDTGRRRTRDDYVTMDFVTTWSPISQMDVFLRLENLTNENNVGDEADIDGTEWLMGVNFRF